MLLRLTVADAIAPHPREGKGWKGVEGSYGND